MVWIIGAVCMIFFGAALVAIGLSVGMWGYAIAGVILGLAGIFLLWSMRRSRGNTARLPAWPIGSTRPRRRFGRRGTIPTGTGAGTKTPGIRRADELCYGSGVVLVANDDPLDNFISTFRTPGR